MRKLSKSIEQYLEAGGWSSNLFVEHARRLFEDKHFTRTCDFEVGRSVIYIRSNGKMIKAYVHHNGRSKEFMTLTNEKGDELATFHYSCSTKEIKDKMLEYFSS